MILHLIFIQFASSTKASYLPKSQSKEVVSCQSPLQQFPTQKHAKQTSTVFLSLQTYPEISDLKKNYTQEFLYSYSSLPKMQTSYQHCTVQDYKVNSLHNTLVGTLKKSLTHWICSAIKQPTTFLSLEIKRSVLVLEQHISGACWKPKSLSTISLISSTCQIKNNFLNN